MLNQATQTGLACGRQPFEDELLHAITLRLAGDEIALRVNAEAMNVVELTRLATRSTDLPDFFQRGAIEDCDPVVRAVRYVSETLFGIGR